MHLGAAIHRITCSPIFCNDLPCLCSSSLSQFVFSEEVDLHFSKIAFVQGKQINKNGQVCLIVLISFLFAAIEDSKDLTVPMVGSILGGFAMLAVVIVVLFVMYVFFCFFLSSITFSSAISSSIVFTYLVEFT